MIVQSHTKLKENSVILPLIVCPSAKYSISSLYIVNTCLNIENKDKWLACFVEGSFPIKTQ